MSPFQLEFAAVAEVSESLATQKAGFEFFASGPGKARLAKTNLDEALRTESNPHPEPREVREDLHTNDNLLYIYTSGTTGLPKAVIIKHVR